MTPKEETLKVADLAKPGCKHGCKHGILGYDQNNKVIFCRCVAAALRKRERDSKPLTAGAGHSDVDSADGDRVRRLQDSIDALKAKADSLQLATTVHDGELRVWRESEAGIVRVREKAQAESNRRQQELVCTRMEAEQAERHIAEVQAHHKACLDRLANLQKAAELTADRLLREIEVAVQTENAARKTYHRLTHRLHRQRRETLDKADRLAERVDRILRRTTDEQSAEPAERQDGQEDGNGVCDRGPDQGA